MEGAAHLLRGGALLFLQTECDGEEFSGKPFEYTEKLFAYEDYTPDAKPDTVSPETRALADTCLLLLNTNEFMFLY